MNPRMPRVNLLVIGPDAGVEQVLATFVDQTQPVVAAWQPGRPFELPPTPCTGTMVLRDIDTLVLDDQRTLLEWLERVAGRTRVISTASAPVLPLVEAGAFVQRLYYRLNTIYIDLTDKRVDPADW
jgi:hypothetical protein